MMKDYKFKYFIFSLIALLSLTGCSQDTISELFNGEETKTITFNLKQPVWANYTTRAGVAKMDASTVTSSNLQLICFDANGGFVGVGKDIKISDTENTATVPASTKRIHFLLNCTKNFTNSSFDLGTNEATAISPNTLTTGTSEQNVVAWGYTSDTDATTIYLKRNVAKLSVAVEEGTTDITSVGIEAFNDMDKGSVAPFDGDNLDNPFNSNNYDIKTGAPLFVTIPLDAKQRSWSDVSSTATFNDYYTFIYESSQTKDNNVGVIVKVTFNDNTTRYLKISLVDKDGYWYLIQRNHNYKITINYNMPKSAGYATAEEAAASTAVATNTLAEIEDAMEWDDGSSKGSIQLLDEEGKSLSSVTLYPNLDYTKSEFPIKETSVTKTIKFWYNNASVNKTTLSKDNFSGTITSSDGKEISGASVSIKDFDTSNNIGTATITLPYSSDYYSSTTAAKTAIVTITGNNITSNSLTLNTAKWAEFSAGSITVKNSGKLSTFTITTSEASTTYNNVKVTSKYIVPASTGEYNKVSIEESPEKIGYWYSCGNIKSDKNSIFKLTDKFIARGKFGDGTYYVYAMADGIKPLAIKMDVDNYKESSSSGEDSGEDSGDSGDSGETSSTTPVVAGTYTFNNNYNSTYFTLGASPKYDDKGGININGCDITFTTGTSVKKITINFSSLSGNTLKFNIRKGSSTVESITLTGSDTSYSYSSLESSTSYTIKRSNGDIYISSIVFE